MINVVLMREIFKIKTFPNIAPKVILHLNVVWANQLVLQQVNPIYFIINLKQATDLIKIITFKQCLAIYIEKRITIAILVRQIMFIWDYEQDWETKL